MKKGRLFKHLKPKECVECKRPIKLGEKTLHVDCQLFTEQGWLPYINDEDVHYFWVLCSRECLLKYVQDSIDSEDKEGDKEDEEDEGKD